MRDFDPLRIASEWHSGQGSALYAYASTDRIPTEEAKDRLVSEIERAMAQANDEQLDELEYLLMHVEESHPDQYPGSEMHEAGEDVIDCIRSCQSKDKGRKMATYDPESLGEADGMCVECGGMKTEGTCHCNVDEAREPSAYDYDDREMSLDQKRSAAAERSRQDARRSPYDDPNWRSSEDLDEIELGWLKQAASKVKDIAMTDVGGPEGFLAPADRAERNGKPKGGESDAFRAWKEKRSARKAESVLRQAISSILGEMKLGVAGRNHFDFGGAEEVSADDVAHMLLGKKDPAPEAPKSGVRAKAKASKRKSKKVA